MSEKRMSKREIEELAIADMAEELGIDPSALQTEIVAARKEFEVTNSEKGWVTKFEAGDSRRPEKDNWEYIQAQLRHPRVAMGRAILDAMGYRNDAFTYIPADRSRVEVRIVERHPSSETIRARIASAKTAYEIAVEDAGNKQIVLDTLELKARRMRKSNSAFAKALNGARNSSARANKRLTELHVKIQRLEKDLANGAIATGAPEWEAYSSARTILTVAKGEKLSSKAVRERMEAEFKSLPARGIYIPRKHEIRPHRTIKGAHSRQWHYEKPVEDSALAQFGSAIDDSESAFWERHTEEAIAVVADFIARAAIESDARAEAEAERQIRKNEKDRERRARNKRANGTDVAIARMRNSERRK